MESNQVSQTSRVSDASSSSGHSDFSTLSTDAPTTSTGVTAGGTTFSVTAEKVVLDWTAEGAEEGIEVGESPTDRRTAYVETFLPGITSSIRKFEHNNDVFRTTMEKFSGLADKIHGIADQVKTVVALFMDPANIGTKIVDALTIVYDLVIAAIYRMYAMIPSLIVRIAQLFDASHHVINWIMAETQHSRNSIEASTGMRVAAQAAFETQTMFGLWNKLIGAIMLKRPPTKAEMQYVNEALRLKDGLFKGFDDLKGGILKVLGALPEAMQAWLRYVIPEKWWAQALAPGQPFFEWIDRVNMLDEAKYKDLAAYDIDVQNTIVQLYNEGRSHLKYCTEFGPKLNPVMRLLEGSFKKIDDLWKEVDLATSTRTTRLTPFCVCLTGATGQGKSLLACMLPSVVAGVDPDTPNLSYTRNQALDHWDGYTGQFAVQFDDFMAIANNNAQPTAHEELMTMISNQPYPLKMAALEEKGKMFRSKMVILTTNVDYPHPNDVNHVEALLRRRHKLYRVEVAQEFRIPGRTEVDPMRAPADGSHWRITERHPVNPDGPHGQPMNIHEFCDHIRAAYEAHMASQERARDNLRAMVTAVNGNRVAAQGLFQDFEYMMQHGDLTANNHAATLNFQRELQELDNKASQRQKVIVALVGVAGFALGLLGLSHYFDRRKSRKFAQDLGKEIDSSVVKLITYLKSDRVRKIDAEGRWNRLYKDIKSGMDRDSWENICDAMSEAMDEHGFGDLTDEEVEMVIDATLKTPAVRKYLRAQGVYGGVNRDKTVPIRKVIPRKIAAEAGVDKNAVELTSARITPQLARIVLEAGDNGVRMNCFLLTGRLMIVPDHLWYWENDANVKELGAHFEITHQDLVYRFEFDAKRLHKITTDASLYELDVTIPGVKDSTTYFIDDHDVELPADVSGMLVYLEEDGSIVQSYIADAIRHATERSWYYASNSGYDDPFVNDTIQKQYQIDAATYWEYKTVTQRGACGGVIVQFNKYAARKIIGIHTACEERTGKCWGAIITRQMLMDAIKRCSFQSKIQPAGTHIIAQGKSVSDAIIHVKGNFTKIGVLPTPLYMPSQSKIEPSPIAGKIRKVTTAPAVLDPRDVRCASGRSILAKGVEKYGNPATYVDVAVLKECEEHVSSILGSLPYSHERRVWTEHEALNGIEGVEYADAVNVSTSAGYPYSRYPRQPGERGKMHVLTGDLIDKNLEVRDVTLRVALDERERAGITGKRVESYWVDTLKDERRPLEKIIAGKTRMFSQPPCDFVIHGRKYMGAFSTMFYQNHLKFFSAVGVDPSGPEWTELYRKLKEKSDVGFSCDYSGWDGNLHPLFLNAACNIIHQWYDDGEINRQQRQMIFDEIIHSVHIAGDLVYQKHIGNPSGTPITAILNTIEHALYARYNWKMVAPKPLASLVIFDKLVGEFEYGDDGIMAVDKRAQSFYNPTTIAKSIAKLGMKFTSAEKDGEGQLRKIEDLTFLKRGFRLDQHGNALSTMDKNTIYELTNWIRASSFQTREEAFVNNLNDSLGFAFGWGRDFFEELERAIYKHTSPAIHRQLHRYSYYYQMYYDKVYPDTVRSMRVAAQADFMSGAFGAMKQKAIVFTNSTLPAATRNLLAMTTDDTEDMREVVNDQGAINIAQRTIEVSGPTLNPVAPKSLIAASIPDPSWTLPDMTKKSALIEVKQWTTAMTASTTIAHYELPLDVVTSFFQAAPFERFVYWQGAIKMSIHINGMRQMSGRLMAYFVPYVPKGITTVWHETSLASATSMNPVTINAAANTETSVIIPYYNPKTFLNINGNRDPNIDFTGTFVVSVLSPLRAADCAATSIDVSIWASLIDDEFRVPVNSAASGLRVYHHGTKQMENVNGSRVAAQGSSQSTAYNIQAYGNIDGNTMPTMMRDDAFAGASASASASIPAFDRAARTWNPMPIIRKAIQYYTHTHGSETVTRLDTSAANMQPANPAHFSTTDDEMNMSFLLHRPVWIKTIGWTTSLPTGTVLWSSWIGPMASQFPVSGGTITTPTYADKQVVNMTLMDFNSMEFKFWRGGIRIIIDVVATVFHTGRLLLTVNYGAPPTVETTLKDAASQYFSIIDVNNEKTRFEFDIKYVAPTSSLEVCRGPPTVDDVGGTTNGWFNYFTGSVTLSVLQNLVTTCSSPTTADILLYMGGSPDYEVYTPSAANSFLLPTRAFGFAPGTRVAAQGDSGSGASEGKSGEDAPAAEPIVSSDVKKAMAIAPSTARQLGPGQAQFGERSFHPSARDIIRRYTTDPHDYPYVDKITDNTSTNSYGWSNFGDGVTVAWVIQDVNPMAIAEGSLTDVGGYHYVVSGDSLPLGHYGTQFRAWRGSLRYKKIFGDAVLGGTTRRKLEARNYGVVFMPEAAGRVPTRELALAAARSIGRQSAYMKPALPTTAVASHLAIANVDPVLEIEVPFMTRYNWLCTLAGLTGADENPQLYSCGKLVWLQFLEPLADSVTESIYLCNQSLLSVGDDFRYGVFMGMPLMRAHLPEDFTASAATAVLPFPNTWKWQPPAPPPPPRKMAVVLDSSEEEDFVKVGQKAKFVLAYDTDVKGRRVAAQAATTTYVTPAVSVGSIQMRRVSAHGAWISRDDAGRQDNPVMLKLRADPLRPLAVKYGVDEDYNAKKIIGSIPMEETIIPTYDQDFLMIQELRIYMQNAHGTERDVLGAIVVDNDITWDTYIGLAEVLVAWESHAFGDYAFGGYFRIPIFVQSGTSYISKSVAWRNFLSAIYAECCYQIKLKRNAMAESAPGMEMLQSPMTFPLVPPGGPMGSHIRRAYYNKMQPADNRFWALRHKQTDRHDVVGLGVTAHNFPVCVGTNPEARPVFNGPSTDAEVDSTLKAQTMVGGRVAAQASAEPSVKTKVRFECEDRLDPTDANIKKVILECYAKMIEKVLNARAALNEVKTRIATANVKYDTTQKGPSHAPYFFSNASFLVANERFSGTEGCGSGTTKKDTEERAARACMENLDSLARRIEERTSRKEQTLELLFSLLVDNNPVEVSQDYEDSTENSVTHSYLKERMLTTSTWFSRHQIAPLLTKYTIITCTPGWELSEVVTSLVGYSNDNLRGRTLIQHFWKLVNIDPGTKFRWEPTEKVGEHPVVLRKS